MPESINVETILKTLPPVPSLNKNHLRVNQVNTNLGKLEALVPAAAPYLCTVENAPALLLIPGLGMDGFVFIRQLPLGSLCDLHFFQTPNAKVEGEQGLGHFARCVEEYILASGLDRRPGGLILGGNSMGGAISQLVAIRGRVKLRALVLIGTFGSCKHLRATQRLAAPLAWVVPMNFFRSMAWRFAGILRLKGVSQEEGRWLCTPEIQRTHGYFGRAVRGLTRLQTIEDVRTLKLPTQVIHGERDKVLPLAAGKELAATIPGARLLVVPGAGHSLFFTSCAVVNAELAEFIAYHG